MGVDLFIISGAAFVAAIVSALSGMGGGVLLFAVLTIMMPLPEALALHAFAQVFSNGARVAAFRKKTIPSLFLPYAMGSAIGIVAFGILWANIPSAPLSVVAGIALIVYIAAEPRLKSRATTALPISNRAFFPIGMVIGGLSMIIGAVGPLLTPFLRMRITDKEAFIGTKAQLQLWVQLVKTVVFASILSFPFASRIMDLVIICGALIVGTFVGKRFLGRLDDQVFDWVVRILLFVAAINLLWDALAP